MTAALIALCAVLAIQTPIWIYFANRAGSEMKRLDAKIESQSLRIDRDAALIAEAYALLHDTAARAKDNRWKPWAEARQKWAEKAGRA